MSHRILRRLDAPFPTTWVVVGRTALAVGAVIKLVMTAPVLLALADPAALRIPRLAWLAPWLPLMLAAVAVWALGSLLLLAGVRPRIGSGLVAAAVALSLAVDQQTYSNHLYLLGLLALLYAFIPSPPLWRWDSLPGSTVRSPAIRLVQLQVSIVFGWTALAKLNEEFLSGVVLASTMRGPVTVPEAWITPRLLAPLAALVVVAEAGIALALWTRWRTPALVAALALHLGIVLLLVPTWDLVAFSFIMGSGYALFSGSVSVSHPQRRLQSAAT